MVFAIWISKKLLNNHPVIFKNFIIVLTIQLTIGLVAFSLKGPYFLVFDGKWYEDQALLFFHWLQQPSTNLNLYPGKEFWPIFICLIYVLLGKAPIAIIVINSIAVSLAFIFTCLSAEKIFCFQPQKWIPILLFLNPIFLVYGPSLGREALFWLCISLATYFFVLFISNKSAKYLLWLGLSLIGSMVIRLNLGLGLVYAFLIPLIVIIILSINKSFFVKIISVCSLLLLVFATIPLSMAIIGFGSEKVAAVRAELSTSANSGIKNSLTPQVQSSTPLDTLSSITPQLDPNKVEIPTPSSTTDAELKVVENAPVETEISNDKTGSLLYTLISSYPRILVGPYWYEYNQFSLLWLFIGFSTFYWLATLTLALMSLRNTRTFVISLSLISVSLLISGVLALILTNYGIIIRFRGSVEIILLPLAIGFGTQLFQNLRSKFSVISHDKP